MLKCFNKNSKLIEEKEGKRVLTIELDENVKKVSITGLGDDETVVMKQELDEDDLDNAAGGVPNISHLNPLNRTPINESNPVEDLYHSDPIM